MADIHDALSQLERRLGDLKLELVRIAEEPYAEPVPPAGWRSSGAGQERPAGPAERTEDIHAFPPPTPYVPQRSHVESGPAPAPPADPQHEIVRRAQAEANRLLADAYERVDQLRVEIEQLLGIRDGLLRSARDLVRQYEQQLAELERSFGTPPPASPPPPSDYPERVSPFLSGRPSAGAPPSRVPPPAGAPSAQAMPPPPASPVAPPPPPPPVSQVAPATPPPPVSPVAPAPPPPPAPQTTAFEGVMTVVVRSVSRLQTIQVLEDSLTRVRGAEFAYVRGYHEGEVRLELLLREPLDLIGEMGRVMPYEFTVESARPEEIVIRLDRAAREGDGEMMRRKWMDLQKRDRG